MSAVDAQDEENVEMVDELPAAQENLRRRSSLEPENDEQQNEESHDPANEKNVIKELSNFKVEAGETYYLLDAMWYRQWCGYVGYNDDGGPQPNERPGEIDNRGICLANSTAVRQGLQERMDFMILHKDAWAALHGWYGGGPELGRESISNRGSCIVEIYGLMLNIWRSSHPEAPVFQLNMSSQSLTSALKEKACKRLGVEVKNVRLWDYFAKKNHKLLEDDLNLTLSRSQIMDKNDMMIEESVGGEFLMKKSGHGYSGYGSGSSTSYSQPANNVVTSDSPPLALGVCGLTNLGNTCFMNSTLQCISNIPPMREYFQLKQHEAEVNRDNPLGHDGKLADTFAELIQLMWPTEPGKHVSVVAPREFKYQIGTFASQFAGYQQHDSSELMQFLLDGLHEDLNRIMTKPYVANPESNGRPDDVVAAEFLSAYKQRNDSKIVDLFCGQFKTTLVCDGGERKDCTNVAVLFEPYFSIPLPLMSLGDEVKSRYNVLMIRRDGKQEKIVAMVPKMQKASALIDVVSEESGVPRDKLLVVQMLSMRNELLFSSAFHENKSLEWVRTSEMLYAYELDAPKVFLQQKSAGKTKFQLYDKCECLFRGEWFSGHITKVSRDINGDARYTFKYDNDGLVSKDCLDAKLRWGEDHVEEPIEVVREQSAIIVNFPHVDTKPQVPRCFVVDTQTSEGDTYAMLAKELGVSVDDFRITVVDRQNKPTNKDALDPTKFDKIKCRPMLFLMLEWVNKDKADPRPSSQTMGEEKEEEDGGVFDLHKSLGLFQEVEKLGDNDMWYCGKCKSHVQAEKRMELWTLPKVMILHLKRFSYTRYNRDKLNDLVEFPLEGLDMKDYVLNGDTETNYDLAAVSNHHGVLGGGHYTAYGRSAMDGKWYKFDDSNTREMDPKDIVTAAAYILYYIRRDHRPSTWGSS